MNNSKDKIDKINSMYNDLHIKMVVLQQNILSKKNKEARKVIYRIVNLMNKLDKELKDEN